MNDKNENLENENEQTTEQTVEAGADNMEKPSADGAATATAAIKRPFAFEIFEWIEIFVIALATVVVLFTFVMKIVTVEGDSMRETLHDKDFLTISSLFYTPKQGDIVVLQIPELGNHPPIIKRVIATEGQVVDINFETWEVSVDGAVLDEPYVNYIEGAAMNTGSAGTSQYPLTVEKDKIFVLGDNRNNSRDSRDEYIKQVDIKSVLGRVLIRMMPIDKFGVVKPDAK